MSPVKDLFGCEWDEPPKEPNDSSLLEDERKDYFPHDSETIDEAMLAMTGEELPPGKGEDDAWVRPKHCLVCGTRDSAAFNRAARFYICFDTGCAVRVGVGGDSTATRMFRPQINTAVRKILRDERWGQWRNTLRRDIWGKPASMCLATPTANLVTLTTRGCLISGWQTWAGISISSLRASTRLCTAI